MCSLQLKCKISTRSFCLFRIIISLKCNHQQILKPKQVVSFFENYPYDLYKNSCKHFLIFHRYGEGLVYFRQFNLLEYE